MAETGTSIISQVNQSGSGLDLSLLVNTLVDAETSSKQKTIDKNVESTNLQISSFGQLTSNLSELSTSLGALESSNSRTATSNGTALSLAVTNESLAKDINSDITVSSLAAGQVITYDLTHSSILNSNTLSASSTIDTGTITFSKNSVDTTITISSANNTLQGLTDAINNISGVTASLVDTTGSGGLALVVKSETGTANSFSLASPDTLTEFNTSGANSSSTPVKLSVAAANAVFTVDGLSVSRSSNEITDLFEGHTLTLNSTTSSSVNLSSKVELTNAKEQMLNFLSSINIAKNYLIDETHRGLNGEEDGSLVGDVTAQRILKEMSSLTTHEIVGYGNTSYYLANLGVRTERNGTLTLDTARFDAALAADPDLINVVFTSKYLSSNSNLKVTGSDTFPPTPGSYSFSYSSGTTAILNGETLTASTNAAGNKTFVGTNGETQGMNIELLSDLATSSTVRYGQSLIDKLQSYVKDVTSLSGIISSRTTTLNENLTTYAKEQEDLEAKITSLTENYNEKFGNMESLVTQLNKTGEYLTSLMDAWNKEK